MTRLVRTILVAISASLLAAQPKGDPLSPGRAALAQGDLASAVAHLQKAVREVPKSAEAHHYLGEAFRLSGEPDSALAHLEKSYKLKKKDVGNLIALGTVRIKLGQWVKATKAYEEAVEYDKSKKDARIPLTFAQAYLEADSLDHAILLFSRAKDLSPNDPAIHIGLGEAYLKMNVPVQAIPSFQRAAELRPTSADIRYQIGRAYYKNRQYTDSANEFQKAIELDPTNDGFVLDLANLYFRAKIYREAALFFKKYVELRPGNPGVQRDYALALYHGGYFKDAPPVFDAAIRLNPDHPSLKLMRARILFDLRQFPESLAAYAEAPADSIKLEDHIRLGRALARTQNPDGAASQFEIVLRLDPENTDIAADLGTLYMARKDYAAAVEQFHRRLAIDPDNLVVLTNCALSCRALEQYSMAREMLERVVASKPDYVQGHINLAQTYYVMDSLDAARNKYTFVLALIDSVSQAAADTGKARDAKYTGQLFEIYKSLGAIELLSKNYLKSLDHLNRAVRYEPKAKDEGLHLLLAQGNISSTTLKELPEETKKANRARSIEEYKLVLKLNPKNETAAKELKQLGGK